MRFLIVCFSILLISHGFGFCQSEDEEIEELATNAISSFDNGWYKKSIELFAELNEQHPFSEYSALACLKIADAHFELRQYADAIYMYELFERLHPRDESLPYVIYRIARAYLNQSGHLDNDQTYTNIALTNYLRLQRQFPENEHTCMARTDIDTCHKKLSGYEFKIGLFYYKREEYTSAISRFLKILSLYHDSGYHHMALLYLIDCESLINKSEFNL